MQSRAGFDLQLQPFELRVATERFETETQRFRIERRQLADPDSNFSSSRFGVATHLAGYRFQNRIGDTHFVHDDAQQMRGS